MGDGSATPRGVNCRRWPPRWTVPAAAAIAVVIACAVPALNEAGKQYTQTCPGGLPCIDGRCGGVPGRCLLPDGGKRPGPDMAWIDVADGGGFCIDTTEVTNAQLNAYVVAGAPLVALPPACERIVGSATPPERVQDETRAGQPAAGQAITFCYAWSYCQWAGKRLCGALGDGGPVSSAADPHLLEWYYACANGLKDTIYPYGDDRVDGACNVGTNVLADAGSYPACHGLDGGFAQVFDMAGSVSEYVNNEDDGGNLNAYGTSESAAVDNGAPGTCVFAVAFNGVDQGTEFVGLRCCADN